MSFLLNYYFLFKWHSHSLTFPLIINGDTTLKTLNSQIKTNEIYMQPLLLRPMLLQHQTNEDCKAKIMKVQAKISDEMLIKLGHLFKFVPLYYVFHLFS